MVPNVEGTESDEFYKIVGSRVRDARLAVGVSQAILASRVGLTRSSITNIEAARQRVPLYHLVLISRALKTDIHRLLPEEDVFDGNSGISADIEADLRDSPVSTRDFVHGAIARLQDQEVTKDEKS